MHVIKTLDKHATVTHWRKVPATDSQCADFATTLLATAITSPAHSLSISTGSVRRRNRRGNAHIHAKRAVMSNTPQSHSKSSIRTCGVLDSGCSLGDDFIIDFYTGYFRKSCKKAHFSCETGQTDYNGERSCRQGPQKATVETDYEGLCLNNVSQQAQKLFFNRKDI